MRFFDALLSDVARQGGVGRAIDGFDTFLDRTGSDFDTADIEHVVGPGLFPGSEKIDLAS